MKVVCPECGKFSESQPNDSVKCGKCGVWYDADKQQVSSPKRQGGEGQQGGTHYAGKIDPWELQRTMQTSGNAFVDARRADAIKYAWRNKEGKMLEDLKKARHCLDAAIQELEKPKAEWVNTASLGPGIEAIVKLHPHEPKP